MFPDPGKQVRANPGGRSPAGPWPARPGAWIDERLDAVRAAVGRVHGVPLHAVVAPVPHTVDGVDGQHLDMRDPESHEVVETIDRCNERGAWGEGAQNGKAAGRGRGVKAGGGGGRNKKNRRKNPGATVRPGCGPRIFLGNGAWVALGIYRGLIYSKLTLITDFSEYFPRKGFLLTARADILLSRIVVIPARFRITPQWVPASTAHR